jgi:glycosyltransferase involved in cell wall biosynthesis
MTSTAPLPIVSVVMPNYNDSQFLQEAIDAILEQSYRSLELIVVDDGSVDGSFAILEEYAAKDIRVRALRNERNLGCLPTVNRGLAEARGKYLYLASSNDKVLPGFFEKSVQLMEAHPQAGLCWTDPAHFFESYGGIHTRRLRLSLQPTYFSSKDMISLYSDGRITAPLHATPALLTMQAFKAAGGYIPEAEWYCDYFCQSVIALRTGMCYIPEPLTAARILSRSWSGDGMLQKEAQRKVLKAMMDLILSQKFQDVKEAFIQSEMLSYFGLSLNRAAAEEARYAPFISRRHPLRLLWFTVKRKIRARSSVRFQRFYFRLREILRSWGTAPSTPPVSAANKTP